jgi:hypothetical protein
MRIPFAGLLLLLPLRALGADVGRTELQLTFGYENGKTDEPLVVQDGVPSTAYAYRADSVSRSLAVSATRWLSPVPDDGMTPYALLAEVSRSSRVTAFARLGVQSRDSVGTSGTFESRFAADRSTPSAGLSASWYFLPSTAVTASVESRRTRETGTATSVELLSQRLEVLSIRTTTRGSESSIGLLRWLGRDVLVGASAFLSLADIERTDESSAVPAPYRRTVLALSGTTAGVRASVRSFLFERALTVEATGSYATTSSELSQEVPGPAQRIDEGYSVSRSAGGRVGWFPNRRLGLSAGLLYATRNDSGGLLERRSTGYVKQVRASGAATWFPSPNRAAILTFSRTTTHTLNPPGGPTFQQLRDVLDVVELAALLRF